MAAYDVTRFSSKVARVYVVELARQMLSLTEGFKASLAGTTDVRALDAGTWGRIAGSLTELRGLLSNLTLAAEWIRRPGGGVVESLPASVGDALVAIEAAVKPLSHGGMLLQDTLSAVLTARRSATSQC